MYLDCIHCHRLESVDPIFEKSGMPEVIEDICDDCCKEAKLYEYRDRQ